MKMKTLLMSAFLTTSLLLSSTTSALLNDDIAAAQKRLEEAARDYAELTAGLKGDNANVFVKSFKFPEASSGNKARLGVHIGKQVRKDGKRSSASNVKGVDVFDVTEGGAHAGFDEYYG